jgi:CubicO group peptidase (beta-lactamase class C family)
MICFARRCLLAVVCLCAVARADVSTMPIPKLTSRQVASIDRYVTAEMGREHIPGLAVGVYRRGQIVVAKGYGLANVELNVAVKPEMIFQAGSIGKQFVSAAVMMLVQDGKVGLDDSIVKYFPNAPMSWEPIRVKNLLSHTSGLAEYASEERIGAKGPFYLRLDFTEEELLEKIEALSIEFEPGENWGYRNTHYLLLGVMIHKVTGRFYADYLQERIFKPLGMTSTRLINETDIVPNRSSGYELHGDRLQNQTWVSTTFNSTADGTLYSNIVDLAKWDEALYGTKLLKQSSLDQLWTVFPLNDGKPNPGNYGFAWRIHMVNGHKLIEHSGNWQGFTCHISRYVDDGLTVVVLTNLDPAWPDQIAHEIAGLLNPELVPPEMTALEDKQPELTERLCALLDQMVAGKNVRDQLTPELAAWLTPKAAREARYRLSLPTMLSGANAFEISDIQEVETEGVRTCLWRIGMVPGYNAM